MKAIVKSLLAICLISSFAASAHATVLAPGSSTTTFTTIPLGASSITFTSALGTTLAHIEQPFGNTNISGSAAEWVVQEMSGKLDFIYQFKNTGPDPISRVLASNFAPSTVNVFLANDSSILSMPSGLVAPSEADRSTNGQAVGFSFGLTGLASGATSDVLIIKTDATTYTTGNFKLRDDIAFEFTDFFAPAPEPTSLFLLGAGGLISGMVFCKKKLFKKNG